MPTDADLAALLETVRAMDEGRIAFWVVRDEHHGTEWGYDWEAVYAGNVIYETETGWRVEVFNDCDSFDYIDCARMPDGTEIDYDDFGGRLSDEGEWSSRCPDLWNFRGESDLWRTAQPKYAPRKRPPPPPRSWASALEVIKAAVRTRCGA